MRSLISMVLRVNLTTKSVKKEKLDSTNIQKYIGGKGLGTKILYEEVPKGVDPLGPENKLIIAGGPATGTNLPLASRLGCYFKSPLTGIYGESYMGGHLAPRLKWSGIDVLIVEGRAKKPVYLLIDDEKAEIRNAEALWGKTTYQTEDIIREELGDKEIQVMEIGPAGERLVKFACICHAKWRQAGRAGGGAVLGSKRLKAIAVRAPRKEVPVANEEGLKEVISDISKLIKEDPEGTLANNYRKFGTPVVVATANELKYFPTRYWHKVYFEKHESIDAHALKERIFVRNKTCWLCPFACGKYTEVTEGPYAGTKVEGPEYETIFAFGGLCEIDSIEAIARINDLCDMHGIDTITMGNVAAFAIEAYQQGKLKVEKTLEYGDPESVIWLVERTAYREGIGELFAEGVRNVAQRLGLEHLAIHVKGLEPAGYDGRTLKGMGLSYAIATRGACHNRTNFYGAEQRGTGWLNPYSTDPRKVSLLIDWENRFIVFDSLVLCRFARNVFKWPLLTKTVNALTGFGYSESDLKLIAERIRTLVRLFNVREGITRKDDTLPRRFMEEPVKVDDEEMVISKHELGSMLHTYYNLRGWDKDGIPKKATPKKLGIN